jgi:cytochrome b561
MKYSDRRWLWAILAASVFVRLGAAFYLGDVVDAPPLLTDQRSYHFLAVRLLEGHGYSFEEDWYPFTPADTPTAHWSFLYPLFLAVVYGVLGVHPLAARVVQAVIGGLLLPWMVYRLARTLFGPSPPLTPSLLKRERGQRGESHLLPLIAAAIAAVYGYFILYAATLMTETFYIVILLWSLDEGLKLGERLQSRHDVALALPLRLGLSLGLAALLRQSILPWVPVLFLWLFWRSNAQTAEGKNVQTFKRFNCQTAVSLLVAGLVLVACIAPFTIRNYLVYDQFLLLNSNTGYAMYSAQHPMHGTEFREFDAAPLPEESWGQPEPELDRDLMRQGIQFVLDAPGQYLLLSLSRVRAFFEFWPTPDTTLLHNVGRTGSFGLFLPFMLYGLYLSARRQASAMTSPNEPGRLGTSDFGLLYLFISFYTVLHVFTWAMVRYRLPVDAVLLPFAALAITEALGELPRTIVRRINTKTEGIAGASGGAGEPFGGAQGGRGDGRTRGENEGMRVADVHTRD